MERMNGKTLLAGQIARLALPALLVWTAAAWLPAGSAAAEEPDGEEILVGKPVAAVATTRPADATPPGEEILIGQPVATAPTTRPATALAPGEEILIGRPVAAAPTTRPATATPKPPPKRPVKPAPKRPNRPRRDRPARKLPPGEELLIGAPTDPGAATRPVTPLGPGEELLVGGPTTRPVVGVPRGGPGIGAALDPGVVGRGIGRIPGTIVPPRYRKPPAPPGRWRPGGKHTAPEAAGPPFWLAGRSNEFIGSRPIDVDADDTDALLEEPAEAPEYFNAANMRDGFEAVANDALPGRQWTLDNEEVFSRTFTSNDKAGMSIVWPGQGYGKRIGGEMTDPLGQRQGRFWIQPRITGKYYTRYFDSQGAKLRHWVGLEIPPEEVATAGETYEWRLKQPVLTPPGWGAVPTILQHRKGTEVKNMLVYLMPTDALPDGTTNVELRLYHKPSGEYLAMNQHDVTIGGR